MPSLSFHFLSIIFFSIINYFATGICIIVSWKQVSLRSTARVRSFRTLSLWTPCGMPPASGVVSFSLSDRCGYRYDNNYNIPSEERYYSLAQGAGGYCRRPWWFRIWVIRGIVLLLRYRWWLCSCDWKNYFFICRYFWWLLYVNSHADVNFRVTTGDERHLKHCFCHNFLYRWIFDNLT